MTSAYQELGSLLELIPAAGHSAFEYDEFASVTRLLADGGTDPAFVLQSSAPAVRKAAYTWVALDAASVATLRGYAESKVAQTFITEDGTSRSVVVMDFDARRGKGELWTVTANLLETSDAIPPGS